MEKDKAIEVKALTTKVSIYLINYPRKLKPWQDQNSKQIRKNFTL